MGRRKFLHSCYWFQWDMCRRTSQWIMPLLKGCSFIFPRNYHRSNQPVPFKQKQNTESKPQHCPSILNIKNKTKLFGGCVLSLHLHYAGVNINLQTWDKPKGKSSPLCSLCCPPPFYTKGKKLVLRRRVGEVRTKHAVRSLVFYANLNYFVWRSAAHSLPALNIMLQQAQIEQ